MHKEKVILYVIVAFLVGFVVGAISAIKFYASEHQHMAALGPSGSTRESPVASPDAPPANPNAPTEIAQLEGVLQKDPQNLQALISLGNLYFDTNQYQNAINTYQRALKIDPKNPDVRTDMGIMYRSAKDYDKAVEAFREAARQDPKHVNSRFNLAIVLEHDKKDVKGAIQAWEDFLKVEPSGDRATMARAELEQLKALAK